MSWQQLSSIIRTDREQRAAELAEPPIYCPNDSTTLDVRSDGVRHCPFDGWVWDGRPLPK